MALRFPYRLAAAACLGLAPVAVAADAVPAAAVASHPDQQLADAVAAVLAQAPTLRGYQVEVTCQAGTVELIGVVRDAEQRDEVVKHIRVIPGVKKIHDKLGVRDAVKTVQATEKVANPIGGPPAMSGGGALPPGAMMGGPMGGGGMPPGAIMGGPMGGGGMPPGAMPPGAMMGGPMGGGGMPPGAIMGGAMPPGAMMGGGGWGADPTPMNMPPTGGLYDATPPKMPPYAWPTYAPHNNYSRVGYPTEYPANAFPFIGPFYPFPKVPLGFRAIKLEWEDGHWYYGRTATMRDHWKVRYW